jgi:tRNA U34 5-carboxymethylaminomethyl modifying enzyme MnmG/GidA
VITFTSKITFTFVKLVYRYVAGTPPRLDGSTIAWAGLEEQPGDAAPQPFAFAAASRPGGPGFEPWWARWTS